MGDLTRLGDFSEKKTVSVAAATVHYTKVTTTDAYTLFELPPNALIIGAYTVNKANGQASLTADFGFAGGAELIANADLDGTPGVVAASLSAPIKTGTGKSVTAKFSDAPTAGEFVFIVHFIEFDLGNGNLMNYAAGR